MDTPTENDYKAEEWMNDILEQLHGGQDFRIYEGDSEPMIEDGKQVGIRITRPHIEFFATGITKLYELMSDEDNKENKMNYLEFCVDRLVNVYGENPNTDYIIKVREVLSNLHGSGNVQATMPSRDNKETIQ